MITAVNSCGCAPKFPVTPVSLASSPSSFCSQPCTPKTSSRAKPKSRQPFENPKQKLSRFSNDEAKCPCPRAGYPNYESMHGKCSLCCPGVFLESKVVSKIVAEGKPYKEIEAIINDNRMVIRIQRESMKTEWDPPCDCAESNPGADNLRKDGRLGGGGCGNEVPKRCGDNVVFQKVDNFSNGCRSIGDQNCRTVTVFPKPEIIANKSRDDNNDGKEKKERCEKQEITRLQDIEENPNIFVLRIRKRSENTDRKNNIDLEFRTPRPWINRPKPNPVIPIPKPLSPQEIPMGKKSFKSKGKKKKGKK